MANADGYVLPKPGVPKTLGILNVIFGVLLVLYGLCRVGMPGRGTGPGGFAEKTARRPRPRSRPSRRSEFKVLDDREKAAKTDEEKKAIEQEQATARPPAGRTPWST